MAQVRALKRRAEDTLDNERRLAKRFHQLNFENHDHGHLYIDLPIRQSSAVPVSPLPPHAAPPLATTAAKQNDYMPVDPTPHKIFIHDLDAELASLPPSPSGEGNLVFLPDIEKHFQSIPRSLLQDREEPRNDQLVLYTVPRSLSVPEEMDSVRKAIIESRARAREKSHNEQREREEREVVKRAEEQQSMSAPSVYGYAAEETNFDAPSSGLGESRDGGLWKGWMRENGTWGLGPMDCDVVLPTTNPGLMWPTQKNYANMGDLMAEGSGTRDDEVMDLG